MQVVLQRSRFKSISPPNSAAVVVFGEESCRVSLAVVSCSDTCSALHALCITVQVSTEDCTLDRDHWALEARLVALLTALLGGAQATWLDIRRQFHLTSQSQTEVSQ